MIVTNKGIAITIPQIPNNDEPGTIEIEQPHTELETNELEQPHTEPSLEQEPPPQIVEEEKPLIESSLNEPMQTTTKEKELSDSYFDEPEY